VKRKTFIIWLTVIVLAGFSGGAMTRFYLAGQWPWASSSQEQITETTQPETTAEKEQPQPERPAASSGEEKQVEGQISTIDYSRQRLTLDQALDDNSPKIEGTLTLAPEAEIKIDGKTSPFSDIAIGDYAVMKVRNGQEITSIVIKR